MGFRAASKIFLFFCLMLIPVLCFSDDGSWSSSFSISGGDVYSGEEEEFIVLEKELLIFTGYSTEVYFLFRNVSEHDIELDCGFPVVHRVDAVINNGYAQIPAARYGETDIPALEFFETEISSVDDNDGFMEFYPEVIPDNSINNSREFIGASVPVSSGIEFEIFQDEDRVSVDDILLERQVGSDFVSITFHFKHKLLFPASDMTVVSVRYSQDLLAGNDGGAACDVFKWDYMIGTGGTWKGPIGEFFFIKPASWTGEPLGMDAVSENDGVVVYHAENYEPERSAFFSLVSRPVSIMEEYSFYSDISEMKPMWKSRLTEIPLPLKPAQSMITDVSTSSAVADSITVFLDNGAIAEAGFGALSAFDGFEETSWSEAAKGDGIGEYLEIVLKEPAEGIIVRNGFKRLPLKDWIYDTGAFESYVRDDKSGVKDYFNMNNRVKTLLIVGDDSEVVGRMKLEDCRDPQVFYGIDMKPGRYRFIINEVYSGTKWADTCIAELTLIPSAFSSIAEKLFSTDFYRKVFGLKRFD